MRRTFFVLFGVLLVPTVGVVGDIEIDGQFKSTRPTGAPLKVASTDKVENLNADMFDDLDSSDIYTRAEVDALVAAAATADSRLLFYLTTSTHNGAQAEAVACEAGFHMASMWEIVDVSNLRYDTGRGVTSDDSGSGPPQYDIGWIRTGDLSWTANDVGMANCAAWASDKATDYGTWVHLGDPTASDWNSAASKISPWEAGTKLCHFAINVWCVED
jgi:hypothetical protein